MSRQVIIRPEAERDLAEAFGWYESQRSELGVRFLDQFADRLRLIEESPLSQPKYFREFRRAIMRRFPYAVFYIVAPDRVVISAVMHMQRRPAYLINRLSNH